MGKDKPVGGDMDQIGGTFHYSFLYQYSTARCCIRRHASTLSSACKGPMVYWSPKNRLWLTLDAIYLMTRTLRYYPYRFDDVCDSVRRALAALQRDAYSPEGRKAVFSEKLGVHSLTAAISIAAELQQFLGAQEIVTEWPLNSLSIAVRLYERNAASLKIHSDTLQITPGKLINFASRLGRVIAQAVPLSIPDCRAASSVAHKQLDTGIQHCLLHQHEIKSAGLDMVLDRQRRDCYRQPGRSTWCSVAGGSRH